MSGGVQHNASILVLRLVILNAQRHTMDLPSHGELSEGFKPTEHAEVVLSADCDISSF